MAEGIRLEEDGKKKKVTLFSLFSDFLGMRKGKMAEGRKKIMMIIHRESKSSVNNGQNKLILANSGGRRSRRGPILARMKIWSKSRWRKNHRSMNVRYNLDQDRRM